MPTVPGVQMAILQIDWEVEPMVLVVNPAGQDEHDGVGIVLLPPVAKLPTGQGAQLAPPRPEGQMGTEHALEVVATVIPVVLPAGQDKQAGRG